MATKAAPISVSELQKRERTKKPTSATAKPASTRPVSSKSASSGDAMKPTDPKAASPAATGKTKVPTSRLKEQEAERKKRLEEKRLKEKEKAEAMAEKRKAMEEKKKQELELKLAKGKPTSVPTRPISGTTKATASTKPGPKSTVSKVPGRKSPSKPVESTDGLKPKPGGGGVLKKPESGDATAATTHIPNGTASAASKKPKASTTPTTTTAAKPLRTSAVGKPGSTGATSTTRPASSRLPATKTAATKAASASLASKSDTTLQKPQKAVAKTSPLASTRTTTSAPAKTSRAGVSTTTGSPVKSRLGATTTPGSGGAKKDRTPTGIPSTSRVSKPTSAGPSPKQKASSPAATGGPKATTGPTKLTVRVPTVTPTTTSATKKGTISKSPGKTPVKATTPGKAPTTSPARPGLGAGAKKPSGLPTKKTPASKSSPLAAGKKLQPKATGPKIEKKAAGVEKKAVEKKAAAEEEKPVEREAAESNGPVEKNDVPQVVDTLATAERADHNGPHPETADATLPAFSTATAERVSQIISSQTSLSKELQSKLPRLGEAMEGTENAQASTDEVEITSQSDLQDTGAVDVATVAVATISTEVKDLPEEFSAEWKLEKERKEQEEEASREERSKRVDEIMEKTRAEAAQMDLVEGKLRSSVSPPPAEQEVAPSAGGLDAPLSSSALPVSGDEQERSPSPTLPIIPDSVTGGSEILPEPDMERGTISAQDSFEFTPALPQSQPPSVEPLTEGAEEKGFITEEPVSVPEVPSVEPEPEIPPVQVPMPDEKPEETISEDVEPVPEVLPVQPAPSEEPEVTISEPKPESPPVSVLMPTEEPASTKLEPEPLLIEVPMPSEPETLKPEPEASPIEVPMPIEEPKELPDAPPTEVPLPSEESDGPSDEVKQDTDTKVSVEGQPLLSLSLGDILAPVGQKEETDGVMQEVDQPSPVDAEEGRDLAEELGEAEERAKEDSAITFEDEEATGDVLTMLPEDSEKEMRQMIDDAAQRIRVIEEQNELDNTQDVEPQPEVIATPSDTDEAPPLPSEPPPDLLSSDFISPTEEPQDAPPITSEVPTADLLTAEQSMDPFTVENPAQTSKVPVDDPFSVGELPGKEASLVDPFSMGEPTPPMMDPFSVEVSNEAASDPFAMTVSTDEQPVLLSGDVEGDSAPAQGPGLEVDLLGGLGGDSAPPLIDPFGGVEPSPLGVDLLGLSEPAPQDRPAVLVDNTAPLDLFGLCAAPEPVEVEPLSVGGDLLGEPLLSTEASLQQPPLLEADPSGQEDQVPTIAPEVQFGAERSPPSEGDLPNDVTPEPSDEDVLSPSPPVPDATPPLPDSPPPLSPPVEGLPSPPAEDDPSPPPLPADDPPSPPADDDPSPPPLPEDGPPSPPADDNPSPPPLPVDDPPADEDFLPEDEPLPGDVETTSPPLVETENNFGQSVVPDAEGSEST